MRCENNLHFLWDRVKHIGDSLFLEIITSSKAAASLYDHGIVVFLFGGSRNKISSNTALSYLLPKE